jgi:hypothetical protein
MCDSLTIYARYYNPTDSAFIFYPNAYIDLVRTDTSEFLINYDISRFSYPINQSMKIEQTDTIPIAGYIEIPYRIYVDSAFFYTGKHNLLQLQYTFIDMQHKNRKGFKGLSSVFFLNVGQ